MLGRGQAQAPNPLPTRQVSARFRPRPMTDSPFFARSIRCRTLLRRLRRMRSLIPTAANCRDSQQTSCAPEASRPRCSAYRPTPAIARATSSGQSEAIAVRPASFRPCRHAKLSGLPDKTEISLTPRRQAPGSAAERAHAPIASQPAPYTLPSWSQKNLAALARLRRERVRQTRRSVAGYAAALA